MLQLSGTGHFARECPEPKKVALINSSYSTIYVSSTIMITGSYVDCRLMSDRLCNQGSRSACEVLSISSCYKVDILRQ